MTRRALAALLAAAALAACAPGTTGYAPSAGRGPGYSERDLGEGRWRVRYLGSVADGRETVELGLLRRAAEVTLAEGATRFRVAERSLREEVVGGGYPFLEFNDLTSRGTLSARRGEIPPRATRFEAVAEIVLLRPDAPPSDPAEDPSAYDARALLDAIGPAA
jgi:hypothetical protein